MELIFPDLDEDGEMLGDCETLPDTEGETDILGLGEWRFVEVRRIELALEREKVDSKLESVDALGERETERVCLRERDAESVTDVVLVLQGV